MRDSARHCCAASPEPETFCWNGTAALVSHAQRVKPKMVAFGVGGKVTACAWRSVGVKYLTYPSRFGQPFRSEREDGRAWRSGLKCLASDQTLTSSRRRRDYLLPTGKRGAGEVCQLGRHSLGSLSGGKREAGRNCGSLSSLLVRVCFSAPKDPDFSWTVFFSSGPGERECVALCFYIAICIDHDGQRSCCSTALWVARRCAALPYFV